MWFSNKQLLRFEPGCNACSLWEWHTITHTGNDVKQHFSNNLTHVYYVRHTAWRSAIKYFVYIFSCFSVGCWINREKVICYQLGFGKHNFVDISTECSCCHHGKRGFTLMTTGAFSRNIKLFSKLKLVTDNLSICIYIYYMFVCWKEWTLSVS